MPEKKRWIVEQQEWPNLPSLWSCKVFLQKYKMTRSLHIIHYFMIILLTIYIDSLY